jgi:aspartate dehydrogenase
LQAAAAQGGGRLIILAGALAGFDGLASLRAAGLDSVTYSSIKPVGAWRGTCADTEGRLDGLMAPTVIFQGSAQAAALAFPRNANLAAAVALAGIGFERTVVELIADPAATVNTGRVLARSHAGVLELALAGEPFGDNPKSSRITAMSAIAMLARQDAWLRFA